MARTLAPGLPAKSQAGMAAPFELHELSMIPSNASSWAMEIQRSSRHHRHKPLPQEGIDGSHNTPASWAEPIGKEAGFAPSERLKQQRHHFNRVT